MAVFLPLGDRKWSHWAREAQTPSFIVFWVDISCLQLHSHIPFPASVCTVNSGPTPLWVLGTQGGQWLSFRFVAVKKGTLLLGSSPNFNTDFTRLCFFTLAESMARRQKDKSPFFLCPEDFFFWLLKVLNSVRGKWPLTSPFWWCLSLSLKWCEGYGKGR